jgi:transporter family-2 protein
MKPDPAGPAGVVDVDLNSTDVAIPLSEHNGGATRTETALRPAVASQAVEQLGDKPLDSAKPSAATSGSSSGAALTHFLLIVVSIGIGAIGPLQGGVNVKFGAVLGSSTFSSFIFFAINLVVFAGFQLFVVIRRGDGLSHYFDSAVFSAGRQLPPLHWAYYMMPGLCGDVFVFCIVYLLPELGFSLFFVVLVSAAMVTSVIVDHIGLLGAPRVRVNRWSAVGLVVTLVGTAFRLCFF